MAGELRGQRVAFLAFPGSGQRELADTRQLFDSSGARTVVLETDGATGDAVTGEYDGLVLPGGTFDPSDTAGAAAIRFVHDFALTGKPVAVLAEGPWRRVVVDALHPSGQVDEPRLVVADRRVVVAEQDLEAGEFARVVVEEFAAAIERAQLVAANGPSAAASEPALGRHRTEPSMTDVDFLLRVQQLAGGTDSRTTERVVRAVFGVLGQRLPADLVERMALAVPSGLEQVLRSSAPARSDPSSSFRSPRRRSPPERPRPGTHGTG